MVNQTEQVVVREANEGEDLRAFFEFPWRHYADDANWTPPLLSQRRDLLDKARHAAWEYMEGNYYGAWRGERMVGTIAAFVNHRHNEYWGENVAWFGMFECEDDAEVAGALLDVAYAWARERGYEALRGPQSFTTHEECGLLVENFSAPVILMPYNPPYYAQLLEGAGFVKDMDVLSFYYDRKLADSFGLEAKLERIVTRAMTRSHITVRQVDGRRKQEEFAALKGIYNAAWGENWGFVPMTERELDAMVESLGQFFDPNIAFFAEVDGELAGFALAIPNFNEVLAKVYPRPGVPELWSLLKAGYYWKVKGIIRGARFPLLGVVKEHRNKGVDMALVYHLLMALLYKTRYDSLDSGWVLETNSLVTILDKIGAQPYKTHRFYVKSIE